MKIPKHIRKPPRKINRRYEVRLFNRGKLSDKGYVDVLYIGVTGNYQGTPKDEPISLYLKRHGLPFPEFNSFEVEEIRDV